MDPEDFSLWDGAGHPVPCEARVLDRWSDESIRWLLVDAQPDDDPAAAAGSHCLRHQPGARVQGLQVRQEGERVHVDTGRLRCTLSPGSAFPFVEVVSDGAPVLDAARCRFDALDEAGRACAVTFERAFVEDTGTMRCVVAVEGSIRTASGAPSIELLLRLHFFAGSPTVRCLVRTRNPRKADHPDGYWDLGSAGSVPLRDFSLHVALAAGPGEVTTRCSPEPGAPFERVDGPLALYQDSSGGENWKSPNHINRLRVVPNAFRGYRQSGGATTTVRGCARRRSCDVLRGETRLVGLPAALLAELPEGDRGGRRRADRPVLSAAVR